MNCAQPADRTSLRTNGQVGVKNLTSYTTGEQALGRSREVDERRVSGGTGWIDWLSTPPGRYMIDWEQAQFDASVADLFGYFALQCGLPQLDCLRNNRMTSRIHARFLDDAADSGGHPDSTVTTVRLAHFEEMPFASQSLDLVVLPHVLEFAHDPHQVLREVDRVLRPEGRVLLTGLNPVSLWSARQLMPRVVLPPFLPRESVLLGQPRLRDWLKLLGFEVERGRFGCFRPPCRTQRWLDRTAFMERAGDRWWPVCGAVYFLSAIKRVRAMRLVGPAWKRGVTVRVPAAVATPQRTSALPTVAATQRASAPGTVAASQRTSAPSAVATPRPVRAPQRYM